MRMLRCRDPQQRSVSLSSNPPTQAVIDQARAGSASDLGPVGPYRLQRLLGQGATSMVYLALDTRSGRAVALKLFAPSAQSGSDEVDDARARFLVEADTAARLKHPYIVRVYEAGEHGGRLWLAMQLLPGRSLVRYTHMSRLLPQPLVVQFAENLARALAHAHTQGVVHRDIKPGNVMLDLPTRKLKLTDFGVAGIADMSRTRTGVVLGTPLYMAPEQLAGAPADARGDQYSLGVLCFQLLSGRLPHESGSLGELLRQVARDSAPDLRSLRADVSPALAAVVDRALRKQPANRFADMSWMADALARAAV